MPGPKDLQQKEKVNREPIHIQQEENDWEIINGPVNMNEVAQELNNILAKKVNQQLPAKTHKNVEALNAYLKERESKGFSSNYEEYRKLAETLTLNATQQGEKTKKSDWQRLEDEAQAALEKVKQEDIAQQKIRENATFQALDEAIGQLLADRNRVTDSPFYRDLRAAAKAYKKETDLAKKYQLMKELKKQALDYAALRFKVTHKTKKGTRRMERVTGILSMMDKLGEAEELICLIRKQDEQKAKITAELTENHLVDINKTESSLGKMPPRFAQGMLPYEIGSDGKVTPETAANYEENMEMIEAYKSTDKVRRKNVILKLYKRLNIPDTGNMPITLENAIKYYKGFFERDGFQANLNILMDLLNSEYNKKDENPDPELKYIYDRLGDQVAQFMNIAAINYLASLGVDSTGELLKKTHYHPQQDKKRANIQIESAQAVANMYVPIDERMEEQIQKAIDDYQNSAKYREDCVPDSKEYIEKTIHMIQESFDKQSKLQTIYKNERYKAQCSDHTYWNQPERLAQLMMDEETDENNQLTETGKKNKEYNDRMVKLLYSENAEDRIAALASCYLRKYRGTLAKLELNENGFSRFLRKQMDFQGFYGMSNTLDDYVKAEREKHPGNELVAYMNKNLLSIRVAKPCMIGPHFLNSKGFASLDNGKIDDMQINLGKEIFDEAISESGQEYDKEKAENGGEYIKEDKEMIAKLTQLCKEKGVLI